MSIETELFDYDAPFEDKTARMLQQLLNQCREKSTVIYVNSKTMEAELRSIAPDADIKLLTEG